MKLYDSRAGVAVEVMSPLDAAITADGEKEARRYGTTVTVPRYSGGVQDSSLGGIVRYGTSSQITDIPGWKQYYEIVQRDCTSTCGGPRFDVCYHIEFNQDGIQCVHDGVALGDVILVDELRTQLIGRKPLEWSKLEEIAWLVHQQHRDDIGNFFKGAEKQIAARMGQVYAESIDNAIKHLSDGYPTGNTNTLRSILAGPVMTCGCTPREDCPQHK